MRTLVGHREFVQATDTLETVHHRFAASKQDFFAVLDGPALLGICARRDLGTLLGARYGFALYARVAVAGHLVASAIRFAAEARLTDVLGAVAARRDEHFYDDVLLTDETGGFLGLIYVRDLVRLQNVLLLGNLQELQVRQAEIAARNRQMEDDLRMAREVQLALMPHEFPACRAPDGGALRFAQLFEPAGGVSGDFFDVFPVSAYAAGIIVCDVMGHGVRSALVTAMVRTLIEQLRPHAGDPAVLLTRLNAGLTQMLQSAGDLIFVTAGYMVVDTVTRSLRYAQAGHPAPLLWQAQSRCAAPLAGVVRIEGPALGLIPDHAYVAEEWPFATGDRLLLFTDGAFEVANSAGEEFGQERLAAAWAGAATQELGPALGAVKAGAAGFAAGQPFADDVCLVACELTG
ncbi:MAG: PP2C family protein-serine/threonine phosphatase [Opitutales bacterium]